MPSEIKQIIFANTNVKLHNYYFLQRSAATDLAGDGTFNACFFCSSFLNLTVKK